MKNPFVSIAPSDNEKFYGSRKQFFNTLSNAVDANIAVDENKLVVLMGGYGSGKTFFLEKLKEHASKKKILSYIFYFTPALYSQLKDDIVFPKSKTDIIVIIDRFEFSEYMKEDYVKKVLNLLDEMRSKKNVVFVISTVEDNWKKLVKKYKSLKNSEVYKVPGLIFSEAVELVKSRLKKVSKRGLYPFTKQDIKKIWDESNGNPRMMLMLCYEIFEQKIKSRKK
ncbi:MAG: DUF2791 family P-loop domain-containing protein [Candidatus Nanoarchaeia archaeon]|nr:DUF2791 family P-loop domain-containing protein [Candidatus Nanoarchaeia archaeon]